MIRSAYGPRQRVPLVFVDENGEPELSRTKQSFKDECDIQQILRKFQKTGIIEHARRFGGEYGDAPAVTFKEAMDIVAKGKTMWEELPSSLKKRFGSPEAFVDFVHDDANIEEARELGLIPKEGKASPVSPPEAPVEPGTAPAPTPPPEE